MGTIYSLYKISSIQFQTTEMQEFDSDRRSGASYRLTNKQLAGLPGNFEDMAELRVKLDDYYYERLGGKEAQLETKCQISANLFHKYLRTRGGRNITVENLAKFCVGAGLSVKEADELFRYRGRRLDGKNLWDYILMCTLENKDDINGFRENMEKYSEYTVRFLGEE